MPKYKGRNYTWQALANMCGKSRQTLRSRFSKGFSVEEAMVNPLGIHNGPGKRNNINRKMLDVKNNPVLNKLFLDWR